MPCFDENMHINIPKTIDVSPNVIARIVADVRDVIEEKIKHVH